MGTEQNFNEPDSLIESSDEYTSSVDFDYESDFIQDNSLSTPVKLFIAVALMSVWAYLVADIYADHRANKYTISDFIAADKSGDIKTAVIVLDHLIEIKDNNNARCFKGSYILTGKINASENEAVQLLKEGIRGKCIDGHQTFVNHVLGFDNATRKRFISRDERGVVDLLESAGKAGIADAYMILADYYSSGDNSDPNRTLIYLRQTPPTKENNYKIAEILFDPRNETYDPRKAYDHLSMAVADNYPPAVYKMGKLYLIGYGDDGSVPKPNEFRVEIDKTRGIRLLRQAVIQGLYENSYELANILYTGKYGVGRSYSQALDFYKLHIDKNKEIDESVIGAYKKVIEMYRHGRGVQKSEEKAKEYLEQLKKLAES